MGTGRKIVVTSRDDRWLLGTTNTDGTRTVVGFRNVMTAEGVYRDRGFQVLGVELGGRAVNALYGRDAR